jgi:hypothetical protein
MKNKILEKLLKTSKKEKSIISARQYGEKSNQFVGYILDFNENVFIMQQVSTNGLDDGILIESFENIETFDVGEYEKAYQFLFENSDKISKQIVKEIDLPISENWKYSILEKLFLSNEVVTIQLKSDNNTVTGNIISFNKTHLEFNPLNNIGKDEGIIIYKLEDISTFTINEMESRRIKLLKSWREKA